jgi:hypothetical protein
VDEIVPLGGLKNFCFIDVLDGTLIVSEAGDDHLPDSPDFDVKQNLLPGWDFIMKGIK